jgi:DHA3 family macrolide efflux protein-like MFS transporter
MTFDELQGEINGSKTWAKRFFTLWGGQAFSILGSRLVSFALIWWLTQETGSAIVLATSTTITYLPNIFLGPFVGALVDRWNRRLVLILADAAVAVATLALAALFFFDMAEIWHVYVLMFLRALGGTFHWPAMTASMVLLVPDRHLARIAGVNQILDGGVNILGPALGAIMMETMTIQAVLAVDVLTALIAIGPLLFIHIPQPDTAGGNVKITPKVVLRDVAEGFKYVTSWRGLMTVISLAIVLNFLFNPTGTYLPLLITDHFKGGAWHLGVIESVSGTGMILGGVLLSVTGGFKRKVVNVLVGIVAMGVAAFVVGVTPANAFMLAAAAFFVTGMANVMLNGSANAMLQSIIKPDMQGRVFALLTAVSSACGPLGIMVAAPVVEKYGLQPWLIGVGVISLLAAGISPFLKDMMNIEEDADWRKQPAAAGQESLAADAES